MRIVQRVQSTYAEDKFIWHAAIGIEKDKMVEKGQPSSCPSANHLCILC